MFCLICVCRFESSKFKALLFLLLIYSHTPFLSSFLLSSLSPQSLDGNVVVRSDARVSSLTLKYVQFTDAGQYLCTARNSIGEDIQGMYLEVRCKSPLSSPLKVIA